MTCLSPQRNENLLGKTVLYVNDLIFFLFFVAVYLSGGPSRFSPVNQIKLANACLASGVQLKETRFFRTKTDRKLSRVFVSVSLRRNDCVCMHFILSRRQTDWVHLTLPKRHASLSSCRQKAFKFNTSCGGSVHYWPAQREYMVALRPLSSASRRAIRTLLKRNQAPSDFLADFWLAVRPTPYTPRSAYRLPTRASAASTAATQVSISAIFRTSLCVVQQCHVILTSPCN